MDAPRTAAALTSRERYRLALSSQPVDRPPAWIMRQAGRYLPEYLELRRRHSFLDAVHEPAVAAEITLQPLRRFPLDAAILFSDILTVLEAVGLDVTFPSGGPRIAPTVEDLDLGRLKPVDAARDLGYVGQALARVREALPDHAVLGFAGAPFTLACYAIEGGGGKDFTRVRGLMLERPAEFGALQSLLADAVADLLLLQLDAGADAVQLFDTWAGTLTAEDYRQHVAPHVQRIVDRVRSEGGRVVVFVKDGAHLLEDVIGFGADGVGLDWRVDAGRAARLAAGRCAVQGNLDPAALFAPKADIARRVRAIHDAIGGRTGHVFNLGHGIVPQTPIAGVEAFLAAVAGLAPARASAPAGRPAEDSP